jgi:hypothetical protein
MYLTRWPLLHKFGRDKVFQGFVRECTVLNSTNSRIQHLG